MQYNRIAIALFLLCFSTQGFSQTEVYPWLGARYARINWSEEYLVHLTDTAFLWKPMLGIGIRQSIGARYHIDLRGTYFKGDSEVWDWSFIPIVHARYKVLETDLSVSRRFGTGFSAGAGFRHHLFHDVRRTNLIEMEERGQDFSAIGFSLHAGYEIGPVGVTASFGQVYDVSDEYELVTFSTSQMFEVSAMYRLRVVGKK